MNTTSLYRENPASQADRSQRTTHYQAWVAKAAKQPMVLETVDPGPLASEEAEIAVEHCGLCHSDLSVLNNDWGFSQYPAILGHEVIGRVTAVGSNAKGVKVGQRVGVGWNSGSCMHCHQWVPMPINSRVNMRIGTSPAASVTTCLKKLRRPLPKRSSMPMVILWAENER